MANKVVRLFFYGKTKEGWGRWPVVVANNGRLKQNVALVRGREYIFAEGEGYYQLRSYEGEKTVWRNAGTDASEALTAKQREEALLAARHHADAAGVQVIGDCEQRTLKKCVEEFLKEKGAETYQSRDTMDNYRIITREFLASCPAAYPSQVRGVDIQNYCTGIERRGLSARTRANRFTSLCTFLKFADIDYKKLLNDKQRAKLNSYPKELVETYTQEELHTLFAASDQYHRCIWKTMTYCGLRMREAMFVSWADVNFREGVLRVTRKPDVKFEVKDKEERELPLTPEMAEELKAWRAVQVADWQKRHSDKPAPRWVFANRNGNPNTHLLEELKELVNRAKLNCGKCDGCKADKPECRNWWLHKFRATYCTRLLRCGVDLRTCQELMGHSDLASTSRYLEPAKGKALRDKVSAVFALQLEG